MIGRLLRMRRAWLSEKLAALVVESLEDLRSGMNGRFDRLGDRMSAVEERCAIVIVQLLFSITLGMETAS